MEILLTFVKCLLRATIAICAESIVAKRSGSALEYTRISNTQELLLMKQKLKIVYVLGPEGAGKTTLAMLLITYLKHKKRPALNVEIRSGNLFVYNLKKFLIRCGRVEYYVYPGNVKVARIDKAFLRRIIKFWLFIETLAFIVAHIAKVCIPRLLGFRIVLTRHVIDFLVDMYAMSFTCQYVTRLHHILAYVLLRIIKWFNVMIYLDADYNILVERYKRRSSYIEPYCWINFYRKLSKRLLRLCDNNVNVLYHIDSSLKTPVEILHEVIKILKKLNIAP